MDYKWQSDKQNPMMAFLNARILEHSPYRHNTLFFGRCAMPVVRQSCKKSSDGGLLDSIRLCYVQCRVQHAAGQKGGMKLDVLSAPFIALSLTRVTFTSVGLVFSYRNIPKQKISAFVCSRSNNTTYNASRSPQS